jgi:SNF2 family DNA or RNA helicase
MILDEA